MMKAPPPGRARKQKSNVKLTTIDVRLAWLCKARVDWTCEAASWIDFHGYKNLYGNRVVHSNRIEWAHIVSREYKAVRWHPLGAVSLCNNCHKLFTVNPLLWNDFVIFYYGRELYDLIKLVANKTHKWSNADKRDMLIHYDNEVERVFNTLDQNNKTFIEIEAFDPYQILNWNYTKEGGYYGIQRCKVPT